MLVEMVLMFEWFQLAILSSLSRRHGVWGDYAMYWSVLAVQGTGVDATFRTAYMHPEKQHKAWFGLFQLQGVRSYFSNVSGVVETCGCGRSGLGSDVETH